MTNPFQAQRDAARQLLGKKTEWNSMQAIFKLPLELSWELAQFFYGDGEYQVDTLFNRFARPRDNAPPLSLRGVSTGLRYIVDSLPHLWTSVSGTQYGQCVPHPDLIRAWIERAGDRPLNLHISPPLVECAHATTVECDRDEFTEENLEIFMEHITRWEGIAFQFNDELCALYLEILEETTERPKRLKKLELDAFECTDLVEQTSQLFLSIEGIGGSVEELSWAGPPGFVPRASSRLCLPNLTALHIAACSVEVVVGCLAAIEAPQLRELYIDFVDMTVPQWEGEAAELVRGLKELVRMPDGIAFQNESDSVERLGPLITELGQAGVRYVRVCAGEDYVGALPGVTRVYSDSEGVCLELA